MILPDLPQGWESWPPHAQAELLQVQRARMAELEPRDKPTGTAGDLAVRFQPLLNAQRPHLETLDRALVQIEEGDLTRVMVNLPSQVGKSTRVTQWGTFWWLGRRPRSRVVAISYAATLASRHGRAVRRFIQEHGHEFGLFLRPGSSSVTDWELTLGGGMLSVGVGGSISGRPMDLCLIDDPHKDRAEADSELHRQRVKDTWSTNVVPRLAPGAPVLITHTRWHPDDLTGWLLDTEGRVEDGGVWTVINMPAVAEAPRKDRDTNRTIFGPDPLGRAPGEPLSHPKIGDGDTVSLLAYWRSLERGMTARDWHSICQGNPQPPEGTIFKRADIDGNRVLPGAVGAMLTVREYIDPAFSDNDDADETGRVVMGLGADGRAYVFADLSERKAYENLPIGDSNEMFGTTRVKCEQNMLGAKVIATIRKQLPVGVQVEGILAKGSKSQRAEAASAMVRNGQVRFAGHFPDLEDQLLRTTLTGDSPDRLDAFVHGVIDLLAKPAVPTSFAMPRGPLAGIR